MKYTEGKMEIEPRTKDTKMLKEAPVWLRLGKQQHSDKPLCWIGVIDTVNNNAEATAQEILLRWNALEASGRAAKLMPEKKT